MGNFFDQFDEASTGGSNQKPSVNFFDQYDAPSVGQRLSPEQATDAMSAPDKFTRAGVKGFTSGASGLVNTIGKTLEGADPKKLAKLQQLIGAVEERMGVDASQYAPASNITGDSNRPLTERIANVPRSVVEMAGPAALGFAVGGLPGAIATTTATTAGPTIDRKREALGLRPDQELPTKAKYEVGTKLATDAALLAAGGKLTQGLLAPVEQAGVRGLTETGKRALMATAADAGFGMDAAAGDKVLIDKQMPTLSDLVVGAAQGGLPGLVAHAPGIAGRLPSAAGEVGANAGRAIREPVVNRTFKPLESLEPESRGRVANLIDEYGGGKTGMNAAENTIHENITAASKGLEDTTKEQINKIKNAVKEGAPVKQEWVDAVNQADPVAGRTVQDLVAFGAMRDLEQSALGNRVSGINPFENFKTRVGDYALAHLFSPKLAAIAAGLQTATALGAKGVDKFTGLDNPAKIITGRYAGTASPTPTVAEARAGARTKSIDFRNAAKEHAAATELTNATLEQKKLEFRKAAKADVKSKEAEAKRMMAEAAASVRALNKRDDLQSKYETGVAKDETTSLRRQADLMRNSQALEERRLAADALAQKKTEREFWDQQKRSLAIRGRSDIPVSEALGRDLGDSQNVPLQELVSSDATPTLKAAAGVQRILSQVDKAMKERLAGEKRRLDLMANSEGASASDAALALKVAKLRQNESPALNPETQGPPEFEWGSSSSLAGTDTAKNMALAKVLERHNNKVDRQNKAAEKKAEKSKSDAAQAKAAGKVKQAKEKVEQAKADSESKLHTFEHLGFRIEADKDKIGSISAYERKTRRNLDDRRSVIGEAKRMTKDKSVRELLDQLESDWNLRASNNRDKAYDYMEEVANHKGVPSDVANHLMDKWKTIKNTW